MKESQDQKHFTDKFSKLSDLSELSLKYVDKYVRLFGWIYSVRVQGSGGELLFVDLNDGTLAIPVRCVGHSKGSADSEEVTDKKIEYGSAEFGDTELSEYDSDRFKKLEFEQMCQASCLSVGCSVMIYGLVVKAEEGRTQQFEVKIINMYVMGDVEDPIKYSIQKSNSNKPELLRGLHHEKFRAGVIQQYMKIRSEALFAVHEFMHQREVQHLDPSIMTSNDCEGAGEMFSVTPQFFNNTAMAVLRGDLPQNTDIGSKVGLTVSSQLPLEAIAMGTRKVYTCQKSFRAEHSVTNKHLAEFLHVEYEEYFTTLEKLMNFTETFVKYMIGTTLMRCTKQYDFLQDKRRAPIHHQGHPEFLSDLLTKPFVRIKHSEAIDVMQQDLKMKVSRMKV